MCCCSVRVPTIVACAACGRRQTAGDWRAAGAWEQRRPRPAAAAWRRLLDALREPTTTAVEPAPWRGLTSRAGRPRRGAAPRWVPLAAALALAVSACSQTGGARPASQVVAVPTAAAAVVVSSASPTLDAPTPAPPATAPAEDARLATATVPVPTAAPPAAPTAPAQPTPTGVPGTGAQSEPRSTAASGGVAAPATAAPASAITPRAAAAKPQATAPSTAGTRPPPGTPAAKSSGPPAPDFAVRTLDGKTFSLAEQRGKTVVLLFTASGCGECIPELQALARVHEEYGPRGVEILALSVDPLDDAETFMLMKRAAGPGADYHWALDAKNAVTRAYDVKALETTVIVDPAGRIAYRDQVSTTFPMFKRELDKILG